MKKHAPATTRNRDFILAVLDRHLSPTARVLEVASGSGEHAAYFCGQRPGWQWQPSDPDPSARASIDAYRAESALPGLRQARELNVESSWSHSPVDAVVCINMIHISPWSATLGLIAGAARCLATGGVLITYGPYRFGGRLAAPSNERFDASLRERNPDWGIRDEGEISRAAASVNLERLECAPLPSNNHALVYGKGEAAESCD